MIKEMDKILVSGLINLETTLQVDGFPVNYSPARYPFFGVSTGVSGVGFNIAKALITLGDKVNFLSLIGKDSVGGLVKVALETARIPGKYVLANLSETPHSVILYDHAGKRQINTDLKDVQDSVYPMEIFEQALPECSLVALCNVNFSRPFLKIACQTGRLVATDVHAISSLEDEYNRDFMASAHILFMSDALLPSSPEEWARQVHTRFGNEIIVIAMGAKGALLSIWQDHYMARLPAAQTRPVINTVGAGDALFACFLHAYNQTRDAYDALKKALVFASYKIGEKGAADGFLTEPELDTLLHK